MIELPASLNSAYKQMTVWELQNGLASIFSSLGNEDNRAACKTYII